MNNFCIVAQGGGMTTAYHAGVIKAFKEKFGFEKLNLIVASSGAAATYSYLVSGQENLIEPIWIELVKSGKFVNPWKFPIGKRKLFTSNGTNTPAPTVIAANKTAKPILEKWKI